MCVCLLSMCVKASGLPVVEPGYARHPKATVVDGRFIAEAWKGPLKYHLWALCMLLTKDFVPPN